MSTHDLNNHDALVGFRSGVQTVNRVGGNSHSRVETEGVVRTVDVIINSLRNTDDRHPIVRKPLAGLQRTFATDWDQGIDARIREIFLDAVEVRHENVRMHAAGAQHRAATQQHTVNPLIVVKLDPTVFHKTNPTVLKTDDG